MGTCVGTTASVGIKVAGTVKNLFTRPFDDFAIVSVEGAQAANKVNMLRGENVNTAVGQDELVGRLLSLKSELVDVTSRFVEARRQFADMQSELARHLSALQAERGSLFFDLEQLTREVNESKSTEAVLRARIAALESELDAARSELQNTRTPERYTKPKLLSQVGIVEAQPKIL